MTRKPFQFGLRDIAWLVLVVALALGWWIDRQSWQAEVNAGLERERAYIYQDRHYRDERLKRLSAGES